MMHYTAIIILIALAIRTAMFSLPHSGMSDGPQYGDFEAQRHWIEITTKLPITEWYTPSIDNDLNYWGLDYPPLTAFVSAFFGLIAQYLYPPLVELHASRGLETSEAKLFMRLTVVVCDILILFPSAIMLGRVLASHKIDTLSSLSNLLISSSVVCSILLHPGLLAIDHGHFQYNGFSIGLVLAAISSILEGRLLLSAIFFTLALNYKQMILFFAPSIFIVISCLCLRFGALEAIKVWFSSRSLTETSSVSEGASSSNLGVPKSAYLESVRPPTVNPKQDLMLANHDLDDGKILGDSIENVRPHMVRNVKAQSTYKKSVFSPLMSMACVGAVVIGISCVLWYPFCIASTLHSSLATQNYSDKTDFTTSPITSDIEKFENDVPLLRDNMTLDKWQNSKEMADGSTGAFPFEVKRKLSLWVSALTADACHASLHDVWYRLFPWDRGLFEDSVANIWCLINPFTKYREKTIPWLALNQKNVTNHLIHPDGHMAEDEKTHVDSLKAQLEDIYSWQSRLKRWCVVLVILLMSPGLAATAYYIAKTPCITEGRPVVMQISNQCEARESAIQPSEGVSADLSLPKIESESKLERPQLRRRYGRRNLLVKPQGVEGDQGDSLSNVLISLESSTNSIVSIVCLCFFGSSLSFFLGGYQVHEKSILLPALVLTPLCLQFPSFYRYFTITSTWSMWCLLQKDKILLPSVSLVLLHFLMLYSIPNFLSFPSSVSQGNKRPLLSSLFHFWGPETLVILYIPRFICSLFCLNVSTPAIQNMTRLALCLVEVLTYLMLILALFAAKTIAPPPHLPNLYGQATASVAAIIFYYCLLLSTSFLLHYVYRIRSSNLIK